MNTIKLWLEGNRHYTTGVKLLLANTNDSLLVKLFTTEGETPFKRKKLVELLENYSSEQPENAPVNEQNQPVLTTSPKIRLTAWVEKEAENEALIALRKKWLEVFKTMQDLRSQLLLIPTKEERCEVAHEILRLDRQCRNFYSDRDYFQQHGQMPYRKPVSYVIDPVQMGIRIQSLKRYIRREATELKKNPSDADRADRRQSFIEELNYYLTKLGRAPYADQL